MNKKWIYAGMLICLLFLSGCNEERTPQNTANKHLKLKETIKTELNLDQSTMKKIMPSLLSFNKNIIDYIHQSNNKSFFEKFSFLDSQIKKEKFVLKHKLSEELEPEKVQKLIKIIEKTMKEQYENKRSSNNQRPPQGARGGRPNF